MKKELTAIILIGLLFATMLVSVTGCSTYNEKIAPHIPTAGVNLSAGGEGLGAGIEFRSTWSDGRRERELRLNPDIDPEEVEELLEE